MSNHKTSEPWSLPAGWDWIELGRCVELVNGRAFKTSEWTAQGLPIIRIQNLNDRRRSFNLFGGEYDPKHFVQRGDLLISWSGTPGTSFGAFVWPGPNALLNQHIFKATFPSESYLSEFLALVIQARIPDLLKFARGGVGLRHLTKANFLELRIPVPFPKSKQHSMTIQRRVVARMQQINKEIEGIKSDVANIRRATDALLDATFNEALSDRAAAYRFLKLGEIASVENGRASGTASQGVRVFKTKHIYPPRLRLDKPSFIPVEAATRLPVERFLKTADVLMANIAEGTLGRLTFVETAEADWTVDGQVMIIRSTDKAEVLGKWLYYYLGSSQGQAKVLGQRTGIAFANKRGQTHIYPSQMREILVPVPSPRIQAQILRKLDYMVSDCDAMREDLGNTVSALEQLRQGVLSAILRGGI